MSDRKANLAEITSGLRHWPATPTPVRARAKQFLMRACSASGRAAAVFALCFGAATLALRQERAPVPAPSAASPSVAPTGMTGACGFVGSRP